MDLTQVSLANFRSFSNKTIKFDKITILVGPNAVGKTNILEAIQVLSLGKSVRGDEEVELIKFGQDFAKVECQLASGQRLEVRLVLQNDRLSKQFLINNIRKRLIDYVGNLRLVVFSPTDLDLVTDSPGIRREHLDTILTQIDRDYHRVLIAYEKALRSRNKLLLSFLQRKVKREELEFWDQSLIKLGNFITRKREEIFLFLNNLKSEFGDFYWNYQPNLATYDRLTASFEKDLRTATTNIGPHRDEFRFILNKRDLSLFGSRGEQRIGVLVLKLAEFEYISLKTGTRPALLLDDIFSELDSEHKREIDKIVHSQQTILTTTDVDNLEKFSRNAKVIEI